MKLRGPLLAAAVMAAVAVPAVANQCPADIQKIDAALAGAQLSQEETAEVRRLRDEGQKLHEAGKHEEAVATLARAKQMLGVM